MSGPGSITRYVAKRRAETHNALRHELKPRQYRNKLMFDVCIAAARSARDLALMCRRNADACLPKDAAYREYLESESARHFKRARGHIEWARMEIIE